MIKNLTLLALATAVSAAPPPACSNINIPIQWTIGPSYPPDGSPSAIQGDGAPYINGAQKVEAVINECSGSHDATLSLNGSSRSLTMNFARVLATNTYTPTWAKAGGTVNVGFLNVRNIAFVPQGSSRAEEYTFTTRLGSSISAGNLAMLNPSPDAPNTAGDGSGPRVPIANSPYPNSLVTVRHCPAGADTPTCPRTTTETWHVYPDPAATATGYSPSGWPITQVGALLLSVKNQTVNAGEFSVPFYFVISSLK